MHGFVHAFGCHAIAIVTIRLALKLRITDATDATVDGWCHPLNEVAMQLSTAGVIVAVETRAWLIEVMLKILMV